MSLAVLMSSMEMGGGSPTATGLLGSGLLFQQNTVGNSSLNFLQPSWSKISIFTAFVVFFRFTCTWKGMVKLVGLNRLGEYVVARDVCWSLLWKPPSDVIMGS